MRNILVFALILIIGISGCKNKKAETKTNRIVEIETEFGKMKVKLYDQTPKHRDNFIKLVKSGFFDGTLFHRVIDGFMIQGGDPSSKNAQPGEYLGEGGPGYQLDAEIHTELFHKKGVLAAAREGDDVNPDRKSDGSQFYLAQGRVYKSDEIDKVVESINDVRRSRIFNRLGKKEEGNMQELQRRGNMESLQEAIDALNKEVDSIWENEKLKLTEEQKKVYTTVGGIPQLDGHYTVFGEVIEGLDIIDKIAELERDKFDRPRKDIKMKIRVLE